MAFGVKIKSITTKNEYTLESFYEAIKDKTFTAGVPSLTKHGAGTLITFPALDSQNQVQIIRGGMSSSGKKFTVQKGQQAGLKNLAANAALDHITGGLFGFGGVVGGTVKKCEQLVETTKAELEALDL